MMLKLYGHPFSSYTWKALIPFYANDLPFEFRIVDDQHPEHTEIVRTSSPLGKFPLLADGERYFFESTTIIEHLALNHMPCAGLIPTDPNAAIQTRMMDRVFDNYVMNVMQEAVITHLRNATNPDQSILQEVRAKLDIAYQWIDRWLAGYERPDQITLIECAAAPSLFYADWVHPIPENLDRLRTWRAHLLALPAVARCIEDARPYRRGFPLGAPDRD